MAFSRVPCAPKKYLELSKKDKGIVRRYLVKISGLSKAQITRLIARWRERGRNRAASLAAPPLPHTVIRPPISSCWPRPMPLTKASRLRPVRRILEREFKVHRQAQYERLASISASHIYNLRRNPGPIAKHHVHHTKTRASAVSIGERRKPQPRGQPGFVRVDTVHQGDSPKGKGLYHINAVDTVTQWQVVGCCETISEAHLLPVFRGDTASIPLPYPGLFIPTTARSFSTTRCRNC